MALGTYAELKTAIETWLERTGDTDVSTNAADLVTLAEARLSRDLRGLRVQIIDSTALVGVVDSRQLTLPDDYLAPVSLFLTTNSIQEELRPIIIGLEPLGTTSGTPRAWGINGTKIDLDVPCDQAHTFLFRYHQKLALSDASPTNWLLTNYPDAYLYACLVEAAILFGDAENAANYEAVAAQRITAVRNAESANERMVPAAVDPMLALTAGNGFNINAGDS